jgi:hypothetical protein
VYPVGRIPSDGFNAVALTWTIISPGSVIVGFGTSSDSMFFAAAPKRLKPTARIVFGELDVIVGTMFWNHD